MSTGDTNITLMARSAIHGTKPAMDVIMPLPPSQCGCTWSCHRRQGKYYFMLKFRYAACLAFRRGHHK